MRDDGLFRAHLRPRTWLVRATILATSLGLFHILATPLHFEQWLGYGVFFVVVAVTQIAHSMALAVYPPHRTVLWLGILGNSSIVILWLITRTIGVPIFGAMAGEVLPVGFLDGFTQLLELAQIVHMIVLLVRFDDLGTRPLIE